MNIRRQTRLEVRRGKKLVAPLLTSSYYRTIAIINAIALYGLLATTGIKAVLIQSTIFIVGTLLALVVSNLSYETLKKISIPFFAFSIGLLAIVPLVGKNINGAKRWIYFFGSTFQPSELLKLALILIIGYYLQFRSKPDTRSGRQYNLVDLLFPLTLMLFPIILILKQPDLGTAIICLIITGSILFFMGIEKRTLALIIVVALAGGTIGWKHLKPYQRDRIEHFLNPDMDYRGKNWQAHQSLLAFSSGGLFGKGFKKGAINQLGYLPERNTDFAFASIAEENGFVVVAIILLLFNFLISKLISIARNARDRFSAVVAIGVAFWIGAQVIINAGMNCGLLPIVGVPFPVISYGGSSLLAILLAMGVIANVEKRRGKL